MINIILHDRVKVNMSHCCEKKSCEIAELKNKHARILWIVLLINFTMFFFEGIMGIKAHSSSLLADALDMLGDALVYGFSLFVLAKSVRWQTIASCIKSGFMFLFGLLVLGETIYKIFIPTIPHVGLMTSIGLLALTANICCFLLLYKYRDNNLNMSSTWLCSRNDLIANVGILVAACLTYLFISKWPDILVGIIIVIIFLKSAYTIMLQSLQSLNMNTP